MGKLRPYPTYIDTGVRWLGEIPEHWSVRRLSSVSTLRKEQVSADSLNEVSVLHYSIPNVQETGGAVMEDGSEIDSNKFRVLGGEILVSKLNPRKQTVALAEAADTPAVCSTEFVCLQPNGNIDPRFIYYTFLSENVRQYLDSSVESVTRSHQRVNPDVVYKMLFAAPTKAEQFQLSSFLDHETAKIDRLIAKQERLIELLKEKRQAVISHAVTKGLNPDAPMKDSGVEWLGEVPEHWPTIKLGYFAKVLNGSTPDRNNAEYWADGDVPWLSSSAMNDYHITSHSALITRKALAECSVELIPSDSVLVGLVGQGKTRGLSALLKIDATINQNVAAIIPRRDRLSARFLHLFLQSIYEPLRDFGRGGNQAALNNELVAALRLALPPKDEQDNIVEHIEKRLSVFDMLMRKAQHSIDLMNEHRTALISAAVTGKIDVRGWQKSNNEPQEAAAAVNV